jgi:hypothetical protein
LFCSAEILAQLAELERQSAQPLPELSDEQIKDSSERLAGLLASEDPQTVKTVLRGILHKVIIERQGGEVRGLVQYFFPPDEIMPMCRSPLGAPIHRYTYSITLAVPLTRKKRCP